MPSSLNRRNQTPLIAMRAAQLLLQAGVPAQVLQLLPGDGPDGGAGVGFRSPNSRGLLYRFHRNGAND